VAGQVELAAGGDHRAALVDAGMRKVVLEEEAEGQPARSSRHNRRIAQRLARPD